MAEENVIRFVIRGHQRLKKEDFPWIERNQPECKQLNLIEKQ